MKIPGCAVDTVEARRQIEDAREVIGQLTADLDGATRQPQQWPFTSLHARNMVQALDEAGFRLRLATDFIGKIEDPDSR